MSSGATEVAQRLFVIVTSEVTLMLRNTYVVKGGQPTALQGVWGPNLSYLQRLDGNSAENLQRVHKDHTYVWGITCRGHAEPATQVWSMKTNKSSMWTLQSQSMKRMSAEKHSSKNSKFKCLPGPAASEWKSGWLYESSQDCCKQTSAERWSVLQTNTGLESRPKRQSEKSNRDQGHCGPSGNWSFFF